MNTDIPSELKGHFLRLYQLAMTDGDFSPLEWKMLYEFAEQRGVSREDLDEILLTYTGSIEIPSSIEKRVEYLYDFAQMILADGIINDDEMRTLKKFCRKFEFLEENIEELANYLIDCAKQGKAKELIINELK